MIDLAKIGMVMRRLAPSAVIFLFGVGALYLADLIITKTDDEKVIALWATLKSFMMIASTFALFGIDQLLVREPKAARILIRIGALNTFAVSLVFGVIGTYLGLTPTILVGVVAIAGFSFCSMAFQWLRSNLRITEAYVASGSWRVAFLLGILVFFVNGIASIGTVLIGAFVIGGFIITGLLIRRSSPKEVLLSLHDDIHNLRDVYSLGGSYFLAALSLAIMSYGENLVAHQLGTVEDVAQYYRAMVMFLFPGMMFTQYLIAIMGTVVRQEETRVLRILRRHFLTGVLGLGLIWLTLIAGGYTLEFLIYESVRTPVALAFLMALTSCVRLLYVLPSSFVGVVADRSVLFKASIAYLICAFLLPILSIIFRFIGMTTVISIALASLFSWILRCIVGTSLIIQRFNYSVFNNERNF